MMKKSYYSFLVFFILVFSIMSPMKGFSQPGNPGGDPDAPITGIEILLGLGGLLGIKKIADARKKK